MNPLISPLGKLFQHLPVDNTISEGALNGWGEQLRAFYGNYTDDTITLDFG